MQGQISNNDIAGEYDWCIAGGYAACPTLANDIDVWILGGNEDTRAEILSRLNEHGVAYEEQFSIGNNNYDLSTGVKSWKVARIYHTNPDLLDRHIIVTDASSIHELLTSFDISTHQWANDSHNVLYAELTTTLINTPPVVLRDSPTTPARLAKITERYKHLRTN